MPMRSSYSNRRKPVYWWNNEIVELWKAAHTARRIYQKAHRKGETDRARLLKDEYKVTRKELTSAIRASKQKCWVDLCRSVETDPWGLPYKIVTKKITAFPAGLEAKGRERSIAEKLFPAHPRTDWNRIPYEVEFGALEPLTREELRLAAKRLPAGKASGPDGVPNELLVQVAHLRPDVLLDVFNSCFGQSYFPRSWKESRLVLLYKG